VVEETPLAAATNILMRHDIKHVPVLRDGHRVERDMGPSIFRVFLVALATAGLGLGRAQARSEAAAGGQEIAVLDLAAA